MMDLLVADLDKEMQEMDVEEKDAQAEYEAFTKEAARKRVSDSKSVTDKEGAKADAESSVGKQTGERTDAMKRAMATVEVLKKARAGEVESLKKAKAVLSGADYSLVQTK